MYYERLTKKYEAFKGKIRTFYHEKKSFIPQSI